MFGVPDQPVRDLAPILAYLERSSRQSLETSRERLLQYGYPPADVDRGIAIFREEIPPPSPPHEPILSKALMVFAFNLLIFRIGSGLRLDLTSLASSMLAITGMELSLGLALRLSPRARPWGRGLAMGGGILFFPLLVLFALAALIVGLCAGFR